MDEPILIKTPDQIEGIRRSCKLAAKALQFIRPHVIPGVTTSSLNDRIEHFIRDHGAIPAPLGYKGYPKATCISVNEVICHGIPDEYVLREGDILNIDVTTILDGYYGDTATMYSVGEINDSAKQILKIAEKCRDVGIKQVWPGNFFGNIGYFIARYAILNECSVVEQFCGHGVGVEFHEPPQIMHIAAKDSGMRMLPGMIFTVEPMLNAGTHELYIEADEWTAKTADGKLSAQFEHTVLVTRSGVEVLTEVKDESI